MAIWSEAMKFLVSADGWLDLGCRKARCALGRGGIRAATAKQEGDGATPAGSWPLRRVLWRPDRVQAPICRLPTHAIAPDDGWCDDPSHADYNRAVRLPHPANAERMWRSDQLYDLVVILGHNDNPVVPGAGSAIFLHLAKPDFSPTEGCVAVAGDDLEALLELAAPGDDLQVLDPAASA
jgi:L,D-peptidoglycan transpeptidase YkuD (ErfK/YbiS/YcfS/YnhG family)